MRAVIAAAGLAVSCWSGSALGQAETPPSLLERITAEVPVECADCTHECAHGKTLRARFLRGLNPDGSSTRAQYPADNADTDLLHNDLRLTIDPATSSIAGSNTMRFRSMRDGLTQVRIRLQNIYSISSITVNNVPINASQPDAANLICTLDRAYASGEEFLLRVEYSGFPQNNG
ncbi:MAG: hypothetical protein SFZ24_03095, partial [Planctomycetota bacterium]|nr:hypothetical protein [Planctomycetota bacterium]